MERVPRPGDAEKDEAEDDGGGEDASGAGGRAWSWVCHGNRHREGTSRRRETLAVEGADSTESRIPQEHEASLRAVVFVRPVPPSSRESVRMKVPSMPLAIASFALLCFTGGFLLVSQRSVYTGSRLAFVRLTFSDASSQAFPSTIQLPCSQPRSRAGPLPSRPGQPCPAPASGPPCSARRSLLALALPPSCQSSCPADPFAQPGMVHWGANKTETRWLPFERAPTSEDDPTRVVPSGLASLGLASSPAVEPAPAWARAMDEGRWDVVDWARGKSILLIGTPSRRGSRSGRRTVKLTSLASISGSR